MDNTTINPSLVNTTVKIIAYISVSLCIGILLVFGFAATQCTEISEDELGVQQCYCKTHTSCITQSIIFLTLSSIPLIIAYIALCMYVINNFCTKNYGTISSIFTIIIIFAIIITLKFGIDTTQCTIYNNDELQYTNCMCSTNFSCVLLAIYLNILSGIPIVTIVVLVVIAIIIHYYKLYMASNIHNEIV